ncbi:hypothetical protein POM88_028269 [Heracleum sosnowskyi]|uniref:Uncharacterized protein n=1 Tax=Heracleum sosnowskyi TaxID=360622 RepID=A0AAD8MM55_9APIA|nr:hypothetical protein POM88_028269 [Heracleum sosnowskyi]
MTTLICADGVLNEVPEALVHRLKLPKDAIDNDSTGNLTCHLPHITDKVMSMVIDFCHNPDAPIHKNLDSMILFDLIQAAHYFEIKSLMDLTCQTLVSMVKRKCVKEIMEKFTNKKYQPWAQSSTERIKRLHERETFIKPSTIDCVQRSRRVTDGLSSIKRRFSEGKFLSKEHSFYRLSYIYVDTKFQKSYFDVSAAAAAAAAAAAKLLTCKSKNDVRTVTSSLVSSLDGAQALADHLKHDHVALLLKILDQLQEQCTSDDRDIEIWVLSILSRVRFTALENAMTEATIQLLLKVMRDSHYVAAYLAVFALTNIVKVLPKFIGPPVESNALTCVNTALSKYGRRRMEVHVAMFFVTICRTEDLSHHVELAVTTLQKLLETEAAEQACYALQYRTYGKELQIDATMSRKLIGKLIEIIIKPPRGNCVYPGYALAVVGNIARWGSSDQIKILTSDSRILERLGMIIIADCKKIRKEACQIISNIAATMEGSIEELNTARLTDPLCRLLEDDEADVKMEAAWAIYNSIYGSKFVPSVTLPPRE